VQIICRKSGKIDARRLPYRHFHTINAAVDDTGYNVATLAGQTGCHLVFWH
jgi:hypothetical protein